MRSGDEESRAPAPWRVNDGVSVALLERLTLQEEQQAGGGGAGREQDSHFFGETSAGAKRNTQK